MRRLRYNVAVSLDGFIAGPDGEYDWILMDETIDFPALFDEFDALLMGRNTFAMLRAQGPGGPAEGKQLIVVSRKLSQSNHPDVTIIRDRIAERVAELKAQPGKDIWLFGGGELFRALLDARLVDTIELALMPVMLSKGIPVLPAGERSRGFRLVSSRVTPAGIVMLVYSTE